MTARKLFLATACRAPNLVLLPLHGYIQFQELISYLDPGTGGLVIGSLSGYVVAALAAIGAFLMAYFIRPLKRFILKLWSSFRRI